MWPVQPALLKIGKRGPLGWSLHWASCYNCRGGNTRETPPMESQSSLCIQLTSIAICFRPITPVGFGPITALSLSISPFTGLHALSRQCGLQGHWEFIEAYVRKKFIAASPGWGCIFRSWGTQVQSLHSGLKASVTGSKQLMLAGIRVVLLAYSPFAAESLPSKWESKSC